MRVYFFSTKATPVFLAALLDASDSVVLTSAVTCVAVTPTTATVFVRLFSPDTIVTADIATFNLSARKRRSD